MSQQTIDSALKRLREEGVIYGKRGTGIFVNQDFTNSQKISDISNLTHRLVLIHLPTYQPYELEPYDSLRTEALRRGLFPVNLKAPSKEDPLTLQEQASMNQLLSAPVSGVLYDGSDYLWNPFLQQCRNQRSVALIMFESEEEPIGSSVLLDFRTGAYDLAQLLIGKGCRRILVYCSYIYSGVPQSPAYWRKHISTMFMEGVSKAAGEAGIQKPDLRFEQERGIIPEEEVLEISRTYDAVIFTTDVRAYQFMKKAAVFGIKVPEDILVAGAYDTIWASQLEYKITSLTQNPKALSKKAFDILEAGGIHHEWVVPEIVERESTKR